MNCRVIVLAIVFFLVAQGSSFALSRTVHGDDLGQQAWPMLGGNAARVGATDAVWPGAVSLRWTYSTQDATNNPSSPASDGSYLYLCHGSEIVAVDLETGVKRASFSRTGTRFSSSPAVAGQVVLVGGEDGYLYALSRPSPGLERAAEGSLPSVARLPTSPEGKEVFTLNKCSNCHRLEGVGGTIGPALDGVGKRRTREWIIAHFKNPQALVPGSVMPSFNHLPAHELEVLADYLFGPRQESLGAEGGLELKWKFKAEGAIQSSPCVVEDMAFFGSDDGRVYAVKAAEKTWSKAPREVWEYETEGKIKSSPAYEGGVVFFSSFDGYFYAVRAEDGSLLWRFGSRKGIPALLPGGQLPGQMGSMGTYGYGSTPGTSGYGGSAYGYGQTLPGYGGSTYGYGQTSTGYGSQTYPSGYAGATGTLGIPSSRPGVGATAVPQTYLRSVPGAETTAEQPTWQPLETIRPNYQMYASPVAASGKVYLVSDKQLYALEAKSGTLRWLFTAQGRILGSPALSGRRIYFATEEGRVYCLNANTKDLAWDRKMEKGESFASPVSIFGDVVLFRSRWGTIYGLKVDSGELAWQYKLPEVPKAEEEKQPVARPGTTAGPQVPGPATGGSRYGVRQVTPGYLGRPGQILPTGTSPYSPVSPSAPGRAGWPGYGLSTQGLRTGTSAGQYPYTGTVGTAATGAPRTTTTTTTQLTEQDIARMLTEVQGLEEKVTSAPVPAAGLVVAWGNNGAVYCFAPGEVDAIPPEILGSHVQFPGEDADYAYALALVNPGARMKPSVALPGSPPIYLSFWVTDQGSGIDPASISLTRNGVTVNHEYRPDEGSVWFVHRFSGPAAGAMEDGDYEFVLSVGDWAGNVTRRKVAFTIDNSLPALSQQAQGVSPTGAPAETAPATTGGVGGLPQVPGGGYYGFPGGGPSGGMEGGPGMGF